MTKQLTLEPNERIDAVWVRNDMLHALCWLPGRKKDRLFVCDINMASQEIMDWAAMCESGHEALLRATYRWAKRRPEAVE